MSLLPTAKTRMLLNASMLQSQGGRVLLGYLLKALLESQPSLEILLYLNHKLPCPLKHPRLVHAPFRPSGWLHRFWWEQVALPAQIRHRKIDVLLSFVNTGPRFAGCHHVLYVQQAIPYSNYQPMAHKRRWWFFKQSYRWLMDFAQRGANRIVCPTSWLVAPMRQSIGGAQPESAYVASLPGLPGCPDDTAASLISDDEARLLDELLAFTRSGGRVLVYPAHLAPYKNIPYLLEAFARLHAQSVQPVRLLLTFDWQSPEYFPCKQEIRVMYERHTLSEDAILAGALSGGALARVYRLSDALVFPSLVESLGLPLLEALSYGLPVVACDTPFAREICGEAALYAHAEKPFEFSAQLQHLFDDPAVLSRLREAATGRARDFSWQRHALDILAGL